jgi:predicted PurR-regulated permease PerM
MKSKELKVEQLITVSKELATVQTQIESLTTQRANLRRRIDTDLLTINFSLPLQTYQSEQSPVRDALRSFGSDFRQAVGAVITVLANVLPWLVVLIPSLVLLRLLWRWISRWIARRERRAEVASA